MSLPHHGSPNEQQRELTELRDQLDKMHRFRDQTIGNAKRNYSDGRLNADDDGDLSFRIAGDADRQIVIVDFGKAVEWIGLPPQQAIELAQSLIQHARKIAKEPLTVCLH